MTKELKILLLMLIAVGSAASIGPALVRVGMERENPSVELVVDWQQVKQLAVDSGIHFQDLLQRLKNAGVTGVSITEDTIQSLRDSGEIQILASQPGWTTIAFVNPDAAVALRVRKYLEQQVPGLGGPRLKAKLPIRVASASKIEVPCDYQQIQNVGVGFPEHDLASIQNAGLDIVGRVSNYAGANANSVSWKLEELRRRGVRVVVFQGEEVLGYKGLIPVVSDWLGRGAPVYGSVEFAKQRGDVELSKLLRGHLVRVHSITANEAARMSPGDMVERYVRAAKERNARLCLVRLLPFATENGLSDQIRYLESIRDEMVREGLTPGLAVPYASKPIGTRALILPAVGCAAAFFFLLYSLIPLSAVWTWLLFALGTAADVGLVMALPDIGRKLLALKAALVFPSLAVLALYLRLRSEKWGGSVRAVGAVVVTSLFTFLGAMHIVGLLADRAFMVKSDQFVGIKLAHILPLLGLALVFSLDFVNDGRPWNRLWEDVRARSKQILCSPILLWQAAFLVVVSAALLILIVRTGNEAASAVSPLELKLRSLLDQLLIVRPRTKEFLIGHPALFLSVALAPLWGRRVSLPLLWLGTIGQVSLINTFCHIHTPLSVSLLRAFNGLWTGILLGCVAAFIIVKLARRSSASVPSGSD